MEHGEAWRGVARPEQGMERGEAWPGAAGQGMSKAWNAARLGAAWHGLAGQGMSKAWNAARRGLAGQGMSKAWNAARPGEAWQGERKAWNMDETNKPMNETTVINRMPIAPDVEKLKCKFPMTAGEQAKLLTEHFSGNLKPDVQIRKDEIFDCLKLDPNILAHCSRCRQVIKAWKKWLRKECGVLLVSVRGLGYTVANGTRRLKYHDGKSISAYKALLDGQEVLVTTTDGALTADEIKYRDNRSNFNAMVIGHFATAPKSLSWPKPVKKS